jgi:hypothetical protein
MEETMRIALLVVTALSAEALLSTTVAASDVFGTPSGCETYLAEQSGEIRSWGGEDEMIVTADEIIWVEDGCSLPPNPNYIGEPMEVSCGGSDQEWSKTISLLTSPTEPTLLIYQDDAGEITLRRCD